ncbi:MAG TPA: hypothetical protein VHF26_26375 [Trebonia sp.]|nr:hypothetical protein [Trebonia sp.]
MTDLSTRSAAGTAPARPAMRFSVDGWDPSYGASLELEGEMAESTATIDADVELPADRWRPIDPASSGPLPDALLFIDGVRRVEAQLWIDGETRQRGRQAVDPVTGEVRLDAAPADGPAAEPTAALCASYAAGAVCCCAAGAHLVAAERRRGLFSVAPHATDISTRAGDYKAHHVTLRRSGTPVMKALSGSLQHRLAEVEVDVARKARAAAGDTGPAPGRHPGHGASDLLIIDGPLQGRQHLERALGYIKSHHATYLPPELNALVGALAPGQRTPVFRMGTSWDRHSWYLRLPGPAGSPWAGVVRVECAASLPAAEVTRLADLSQRCLGRFASSPYKDSRAPQNLYPIAGLERELRRRLGDPRLLYRALREAARPAP